MASTPVARFPNSEGMEMKIVHVRYILRHLLPSVFLTALFRSYSKEGERRKMGFQYQQVETRHLVLEITQA